MALDRTAEATAPGGRDALAGDDEAAEASDDTAKGRRLSVSVGLPAAKTVWSIGAVIAFATWAVMTFWLITSLEAINQSIGALAAKSTEQENGAEPAVETLLEPVAVEAESAPEAVAAPELQITAVPTPTPNPAPLLLFGKLIVTDGAGGHAKAIDRCADELETRDATHEQEALTLAEAVIVSGYSDKQLRRLVHQGELKDVGMEGKLALRRGDLPRKVKSQRQTSEAARHFLGHHQS